MGKRILIIEDELAVLELATYLLQAAQHQVLVAENGVDGLAAAQQSMPDLVLCDWQVPGIDGLGVVTQLKKYPSTRQIIVIAFTGLAMIGDREMIMAAKFDGRIPKPIVPEKFAHQVAAFLDFGARPPQRNPLPPPAAASSAPGVAPGDASRGVVLLVEHDVAKAEMLRQALEGAGYFVLRAAHCYAALEITRRVKPDLVLCDLHLPEKDGFSVLTAIKSDPSLRGSAVALMSSEGFVERDRAIGLKLGAVRLIARNDDPTVFLAEVKSCLSVRKPWLS